MSDVNLKKLIGEALIEIVDAAKGGGKFVPIGLMSSGSELGSEEMALGGRLAQQQYPFIKVVMIGPRVEGFDDLEWIETDDCEADIQNAMEKALKEGRIKGAVALHYPFPLGVATVGMIHAPAKGKPLIISTSTGTSSANRVEAMVLNAIYGVAVAKARGIKKPEVGILNVDGAQMVYRSLRKLAEGGYDITFGSSVRSDGGPILRGNDLIAGSVDVCVTDTLTGNVLVKIFSAYNTGGNYEALGWGYGPSVGEGWGYVVSIISRASGAHVIANAIYFTAEVSLAGLPSLVRGELERARNAGLESILAQLESKGEGGKSRVEPPKPEPTDEEIHGIDVLTIEDAVKTLWASGIYAESAMGCTGPVVKVPSRFLDKAKEVLAEGGYL
ncbi:glycine/sarcosine/betaine reductase complex component C subunit alpha [Acetomicrobium hydrogeniformans]|uniref:Fatty acid/phospholipid synthesis protein PlsX n=1 Tax=Acetomicrobium hydrogeniformans ATCC BAA-1850 TaxID=592015 RepID=A0A0T5XBJ5_9BACT|nr:glycine/sarcosine/betaine reductase complex component C subunit alpha [Acetomicrobium hydrogeniformans]KRT35739.1 fatty acid/phospholipid synthesis protein PlsX [Acetomicrobium hydrogeniformans ATCC BAA-1850]